MKELFIIRHAKTERIQVDQRDFDRKLAHRGLLQCADLIQHLGENLRSVDTVFVSSAKRTKMTFDLLKKIVPTTNIEFRDDLYLASSTQIMQTLVDFADVANSVLLIGHNEGVSDLASYFLDDSIHVPTSGFMHFQFGVDSWAHIFKGSGVLINHYFSEAR